MTCFIGFVNEKELARKEEANLAVDGLQEVFKGAAKRSLNRMLPYSRDDVIVTTFDCLSRPAKKSIRLLIELRLPFLAPKAPFASVLLTLLLLQNAARHFKIV